jgi:predicted phosphodiesterase
MPLPKVVKAEDYELISRYHLSYPMLKINQLSTLIKEKEKVRFTHETFRKMVGFVVQSNKRKNSFKPEKEIELKLPESIYKEQPFFILPKDDYSILVINDIHIPFHDVKALTAALKEGKRRKVKAVILNGDVIDFYGISRFSKTQYVSIKAELNLAADFFTVLRKYFPSADIIYKTGNHEDRWKVYLWNQSMEIAELESLRLENLLSLNKLRIDFVDDKRVIKVGSAYIVHGHELYSSAGAINVARNIRLKTLDNTIFGHFHKTQEDYQTAISRNMFGSWSIGCLCGLRPSYMPLNNWNHGFGILNLQSDGSFEFENKKIIDGCIR